MIEIFHWVMIGFLSWVATGMDDFLVVYALSQKQEKHSLYLPIITGTLCGTLLLLGFSALLSHSIVGILTESKYIRLAGLIPIALGMKALHDSWLTDQHSGGLYKTGNRLKYFGYSIVIYIGNGSDDLAVNSAWLMKSNLQLVKVTGYIGGNLLACLILSLCAISFSKIFTKNVHIEKIAGTMAALILISMGLAILLHRIGG
ncbi:cadmium resistance transporter [Patescibacteria group bacterium]